MTTQPCKFVVGLLLYHLHREYIQLLVGCHLNQMKQTGPVESLKSSAVLIRYRYKMLGPLSVTGGRRGVRPRELTHMVAPALCIVAPRACDLRPLPLVRRRERIAVAVEKGKR